MYTDATTTVACPLCHAVNDGATVYCTSCGAQVRTQRWSDLPAWKRRMVVGLCIGGVVLGVLIAAQDSATELQITRLLAVLGYSLGTLLGVMRTFLAYRYKQSVFIRIMLPILTLLMAGLAYDAMQ